MEDLFGQKFFLHPVKQQGKVTFYSHDHPSGHGLPADKCPIICESGFQTVKRHGVDVLCSHYPCQKIRSDKTSFKQRGWSGRAFDVTALAAAVVSYMISYDFKRGRCKLRTCCIITISVFFVGSSAFACQSFFIQAVFPFFMWDVLQYLLTGTFCVRPVFF